MIASAADLPFFEQPPYELLAIGFNDSGVLDDYEGYGWVRLDRVVLEEESGSRREVRDALVLAMHIAEDSDPLEDDVDLEFRVDPTDDANEECLFIYLSKFLAAWLPKLPRDPRAIVLALCNPHRVPFRRPPEAPAGVPIWHALGDVLSWCEESPSGAVRLFGLEASRWRTI